MPKRSSPPPSRRSSPEDASATTTVTETTDRSNSKPTQHDSNEQIQALQTHIQNLKFENSTLLQRISDLEKASQHTNLTAQRPTSQARLSQSSIQQRERSDAGPTLAAERPDNLPLATRLRNDPGSSIASGRSESVMAPVVSRVSEGGRGGSSVGSGGGGVGGREFVFLRRL